VRHKLARQVGGYQINMKLVEVKVVTHKAKETFDASVCYKIPFAWGEQHRERFVFEAEYSNSKNANHSDNAEKHLAQHLKMPSESQ
jgi:hypothetical protein